MAQTLKLTANSVPVVTTGTAAFTLLQVDAATLLGGAAIVDGTVKIRATVVKHEVGGGTYSVNWEEVGVFRVSAGTPVFQNSIVAGNNDGTGQVGQVGTDTITFDVSGTNLRLRCTPQSGNSTWYTSFDIQAVIP